MPEMKARYSDTYPEIDIMTEFADIASLPILTYDITDAESYLCLGTAIWMLDQIWEEHEMQELCDLVPDIAKEMAAAQLKTKFWEWADLYFKALNPLIYEMRKRDKALDCLTKQIDGFKGKVYL